jgi:RNA polymerase sigma-70 factor (ECF subfamily)
MHAQGQPTATDERDLIEAAQGDPRLFGPLYEANFHRVYAYIAKRVGDRTTAEDLTSEVFREAIRGLRRFQWQGTPFIAWLLRIGRDAISDHFRKTMRDGGAPSPALPEPEQESIERAALIFQLVERLPAAQQRVIEARFVEQRSIREIAEELDRSEGAVKQLQLRALENLREAMEGGSR